MILCHYRLDTELANCYLLADKERGDVILIDAGEFRSELVVFVHQNHLNLRQIFITHSHHDHNGAVEQYREAFGNPDVLGGSTACGGKSTRVLKDGDEVMVGPLRGQALAVPGHTPDQMCLYFPELRVLFTGDSLFAGSVGGTAGTANREEQIRGIKEKLLSLPEDVHVYSGHGPATTIYIEKNHNPFLT